ncbi:splicing factor 1-like isoform X2 [Corticium candelabrum]|uniref:splicing factor 1-like isoform X2 n=1 Tax=Corticium candelabrum TaxID=121492 RepID=UPI002E259D25|nr:splicing factor 1-like isoform X2 [Corticium candelabrum]
MNLDINKKKKKKSRWAQDEARTIIPGMPTSIPINMSAKDQKVYLMTIQVEELSRKLRTGDFGIPLHPEDRSPSPEPIYDHQGKRMNTREYRTKKKLEDERHKLVLELQETNPEYRPPVDYKAPMMKVQDKVWIPQEEHPDINFIGLLIGPRGMTLKQVEQETKTKIIIRGKGSVKAGKIGIKPGQPMPGEDEPLHALVTASNQDDLQSGIRKINEMIRHGIEVPDSESEIKKEQLKQLALYNGTFRQEDLLQRFIQPEQPSVTSQILCTKCGGYGHPASDCKVKIESSVVTDAPSVVVDKAKMDSEYQSLMAELGEAPAPTIPEPAVKTEPSGAILPTPVTTVPDATGQRAPPLMNTPGVPQTGTPAVAAAQVVWPGAYNPWQAYYGMLSGVVRPTVGVTATGLTLPGLATSKVGVPGAVPGLTASASVAGYTNQWLQQMRLAAPPPPPGTQ